jgi:hypothetical protein
MDSKKYIGMDVRKESISIAVMNASGKIGLECVIETKASMILQFFDGLRADLQVTFEEGTSAAWLYDLLKPHVTKLVVCDPRKNAAMREGNQELTTQSVKEYEQTKNKYLKTIRQFRGTQGNVELVFPKNIVTKMNTVQTSLSELVALLSGSEADVDAEGMRNSRRVKFDADRKLLLEAMKKDLKI